MEKNILKQFSKRVHLWKHQLPLQTTTYTKFYSLVINLQCHYDCAHSKSSNSMATRTKFIHGTVLF